MTVPLPLICGVVAAVVVLVVLVIIFKILQKKRKANQDSAGNGSKNGDYKKLEDGVDELEDEPTTDDPTGATKSKNKKRKRKGKGKGQSKRLSDGTEGITDGTGVENETTYATPMISQVLIARLQISVACLPSSKQLLVTIHEGENLPFDNLTTAFEIRITLLPAKTQRFKTKSQSSFNPIFDELFTFYDVFPEDIQAGALRARVYKLKGRKRNLVGEIKAELIADLGLEGQNVEYQWREITPAHEILDDISDTVILTDPEAALMAPKETVPMIQVSLQHKSVTGKLIVEIIKARHMKTISGQKAPETYVDISLLNFNGTEIANAKTNVLKGSFHPIFEQQFYFTAIEFDLPDLTVVFSVFCKKFRTKLLIGRFGIGRESTGEREKLHWDEMMDSKGEPVKGWYTFGQE